VCSEEEAAVEKRRSSNNNKLNENLLSVFTEFIVKLHVMDFEN